MNMINMKTLYFDWLGKTKTVIFLGICKHWKAYLFLTFLYGFYL